MPYTCNINVPPPPGGMLTSANALSNIPTSGAPHCRLHGRTFNDL